MDVKEEWDFYLCKVDDGPASIFLDLGLAPHAPLEGADTLCAVRIGMAAPDAHGMGAPQEAEALYAIEDSISNGADRIGLRFVGRLRNHGVWQMAFMGPPRAQDSLEHLASEALQDSARRFDVVHQPDPQWSYYRDFLYPDGERMRWIWDRRLVERLESHGDPLTKERRVDHRIYFERRSDREAFASADATSGFECSESEPGSDESRSGLQVQRVDSVRLEDIHAVVMELHRLARQHAGEYDGWGTSVEAGD